MKLAILSRNSAEYLEALSACALGAMIAVNLNHRLTVAELAPICADCEPSALICSTIKEGL